MALGTAALLVARGGVAYATGNVPAFMADEFDVISPSKIRGMEKVASFTIDTAGSPREFEIFRARTADGEVCSLLYEGAVKPDRGADGACGEALLDGWFRLGTPGVE